MDDITALRHFLTTALTDTGGLKDQGVLLVVVDHHAANIYQLGEEHPDPATVRPEDPHGHLRHLHNIEGHYQGQRVPERPAYYQQIYQAVRDARTVVVFGHGDGHSDTARRLADQLMSYRVGATPDLLVDPNVDAKQLTGPQLVVAAREAIARPQNAGTSSPRVK